MNGRRYLKAVLVASALMLAVPAAAAQQPRVNTTDIQRLQDDVYQASADLSRLRSSDSTRAAQLQSELDDLRDEVTYLKVKLRKDGSVDRSEYTDVRDRIQEVRSRARGDVRADSRGDWSSSNPSSSTGSSSSRPELYPGQAVPPDDRRGTSSTSAQQGSTRGTTEIPSGQEIDVRLERQLSSETAQVEDRFEATTVVDMYEGNRVLIPAGSVMRGVVTSVSPATRTDRKGSLTVSFDQVTVRGRAYPMRGTVTQALESEGIKGEAAKIGAGSAVGAIIGGIIGGVKGAVIGVLIGGGGTIAATEGTDVTLPPGTILRVRFDNPPNIR